MRLFITDSRIPELAEIKSDRRRCLKRSAVAMLRKHKPLFVSIPVVLCSLGAGLGWWIIPFAFGLFGADLENFSNATFFSFIGIGLGGTLAGWVGNEWLAHKLRPYLRNLIGQTEKKNVSERCQSE